MKAELLFAMAYLACAVLALIASRTRSTPAAVQTSSFWLRIAIISGAFSLLRYFDAQIVVSSVFWHFGHATGLTGWMRPGPYIMLAAICAFGAAVTGLFIFRTRSLHPSVSAAAMAIASLALLAVAHSVSLYMTGAYLQAAIGSLTLSRIIEAVLIVILATSSTSFIASARRSEARSPDQL